ncbi:MAG: histidine phosphatase family protein [Pseudomonadales bacterium]|nr:histidine phosphatase family protein [Pseudomonadales bacterium]
MTTFLMIRHGETNANKEQLWHGSTDTALNSLGLTQADNMGRKLGEKYSAISKIYASPLSRTMKTASALGKVIDKMPVAFAGLREYGIGSFEGQSMAALTDEHSFFASISSDQDYAPKGGESINQVRDRMLAGLGQIAAQHRGETIALVSHGAAMAILLAALFQGAPFPFDDYHMSNTGITQLDWPDTHAPTLVSFDDTSHLI